MKPAPFSYLRMDSLAQACAALAEAGEDARILAGGQSLLPALNMRLSQPRVLLDISRCDDLRYVRVDARKGWMDIGAATTQGEVEWRATLAQEVPLLAAAFPYISHFQIKNRGTVCGSIAHADPSAELPLCLALLGGEVSLRGRGKPRRLKASEFFQGMLTTAKRADELVEAVHVPLARPGTGYAFEEFSLRRGDFAIVACAAAVDQAGMRLGVGGVADRPTVKEWPHLNEADLAAALNDFAWELQAQDDAHASASYRRHLVRRLGLQVLQRAGQQARGSAT